MQKRTTGVTDRKKDTSSQDQRLFNLEGVCHYLSMGRNSARKWCEEIGAIKRFGRSTRYDRVIIDENLDTFPSSAPVKEQ